MTVLLEKRQVAPSPQWMADALCAAEECDPDMFFPEPGQASRAADAVKMCRSCPVRAECLRFSFEGREQWGIWGGKTAYQRSRVRNRMSRG